MEYMSNTQGQPFPQQARGPIGSYPPIQSLYHSPTQGPALPSLMAFLSKVLYSSPLTKKWARHLLQKLCSSPLAPSLSCLHVAFFSLYCDCHHRRQEDREHPYVTLRTLHSLIGLCCCGAPSRVVEVIWLLCLSVVFWNLDRSEAWIPRDMIPWFLWSSPSESFLTWRRNMNLRPRRGRSRRPG